MTTDMIYKEVLVANEDTLNQETAQTALKEGYRERDRKKKRKVIAKFSYHRLSSVWKNCICFRTTILIGFRMGT